MYEAVSSRSINRAATEVEDNLKNGAWRSLASAPALGAGGRRFKSSRPDH